MAFEDCLWSVQAQHRVDTVRDLTEYYKGMLAFFWLMSFSQKTRAEVSPILEGYHTVERIEKEQDPLNPKIDVKVARFGLVLEAEECTRKHPILRVLYGLQAPSLTTYASSLAMCGRDYYDRWLQARNAHVKE